MRKPLNDSIANKMFREKKPHYASEKALLLTADLSTYQKWGKDQIDERQRKMAKLAVKSWPATGS